MHSLEIDASITSLAPGGDGVAHVELGGERRAVFVPGTAPGDRARLEVDASRRPARGRVVSLVSAGADRVSPPCPWSARCGGCDWMHLALPAQTRTHVEHLRAALPGSWRAMEIGSAPAPEPLGYRTRARVHVRSLRNGSVVVGMHEARSHEPVEVENCAVLDPTLEAVRRALAPLLEGSRGRGDVQIGLGAGRVPVLDVHWDGDLPPQTYARIEAAVAGGRIAGAQVVLPGATRPARIGDPTPWMAGGDGAPVRLSPGGFAQAAEAVNAALTQHVARVVQPWQADKAVELYSGSGNLSILLAREVGDLACVESSRDACEAARDNLRARGVQNARVVEADAAAYAWSKAVRLVVLDPPRAGARAVAERLAASRVAHVVYVSCDAQTLGRDLALLEKWYAPVSITSFEMFPQTSHAEAVVALERRRS
ncbi:MAG TPA: methyltransferase [Polyangiaceae bacterium]|nr:methyltransferase [Polyangiaceae bacterium]